MKCTGLSECQRLQFLLENTLLMETSKWKVPCFLDSTIKGTDISPMQYAQVVLWMDELRLHFQFYPETFGSAASFLNRILATVKVQVKYLRCIAITCLYLAAKTNEEDEIIPSVKKLAVQSGCLYSSAEILRMERIILDKLQWDLYTATPVDFLNIVDGTNFIHCKELVDQCLEAPSNPVYILISANKGTNSDQERFSCCIPSSYCQPVTRIGMTKSPSNTSGNEFAQESVMETDDFYDGFQYLYNEDRIPDTEEIAKVLVDAKSQLEEKGSGQCPLLQPPQTI
ncbi:cyclin-I2 [Lithobates pipiens]